MCRSDHSGRRTFGPIRVVLGGAELVVELGLLGVEEVWLPEVALWGADGVPCWQKVNLWDLDQCRLLEILQNRYVNLRLVKFVLPMSC